MKTTTRDRLREEYAKLVKIFAKNVKGLNIDGIPAPHIPVVGNYYDECAYKMAFVGMETYGWGNITDFVDLAERSPKEAATMYESWFNAGGMVEHSGSGTFWGFIIEFLEHFYKLEKDSLKHKSKEGIYHEVLSSIIWGNSNAIERYEVTAKKQNVDIAEWRKVKEYSKPLDSINHIIKAANPTVTKPIVIFLTYKYVDENYIVQDSDIHKEIPETKYTYSYKHVYHCDGTKDIEFRYYYLRDQHTHVFVTPHPRWIGVHSGIKFTRYIDALMQVIKEHKIWATLPKCIDDWKIKEENRSSSSYKYKFIAELADFLVDRNLVMTGEELQAMFNNNNIKRNKGGKYSEEGGRGIHTVIRKAWNHYYNKGEYQIALNITRAFVGKNLHYTYK